MRWFRRGSGQESSPAVEGAEEPVEIGDEHIVFWKANEQVDGEDFGPVWIADANDPNVTLDEPDLWLRWGEAEEFARKRGLPLEDV
jgi:hypothetical protein